MEGKRKCGKCGREREDRKMRPTLAPGVYVCRTGCPTELQEAKEAVEAAIDHLTDLGVEDENGEEMFGVVIKGLDEVIEETTGAFAKLLTIIEAQQKEGP